MIDMHKNLCQRDTESVSIKDLFLLVLVMLQNLEIRAVYLIILSSFCLKFLFIGTNDLLAEEAYYWNYASHLDFGYLDHPPMVAVLIHFSTWLLGIHEYAVRFPTLVCWGIMALFSFQLSQLIRKGTGLYAVMLIATLPFFFIHSMVITPDQPLCAAWSAALYFLYRALILNEAPAWYKAGIAIGLGLLSKYTIVLLGPATLLFILIFPQARYWLKRKEPYLCLLISLLCFTPVIYWNVTHEWQSFIFQGSRRFQAGFSFSFHEYLGLIFLFLLPPGIIGFYQLTQKNLLEKFNISLKTQRFLQVFTLVPLLFFGLFSVSHAIKFNWIGPSFLALIPWLAFSIQQPKKVIKLASNWLLCLTLLLMGYGIILGTLYLGQPTFINQKIFRKFISWEQLSEDVAIVADKLRQETQQEPAIIPLDLYNMSSELSFYQAKNHGAHPLHSPYLILGRHIFDQENLMYRFWINKNQAFNKPLILMSTHPADFEQDEITRRVIKKSPPQLIWAKHQSRVFATQPIYYQFAELK